jgi:hypothetical protein
MMKKTTKTAVKFSIKNYRTKYTYYDEHNLSVIAATQPLG